MTIDDALAGVDDSRYETEVRERWGDEAWERSAARRRALTPDQRRAADERGRSLNAALRDAAERGLRPDDPELQGLVATHHGWIVDQWGRTPDAASYTGLGELYVADARFAAVYGGERNARVIRDAMAAYADAHLR